MRTGIAYILTFQNGKVYIGITREGLSRRIERHIAYARSGKHFALSSAIRKYGESSFTSDVVGRGTWEELQAIEISLIAKHNSCGAGGYNMTFGGEGSLGISPSEETRKRIGAAMSKALSGRTLTDEHKRRVGDAFRGKPLSLETRKKMSDAAKARVAARGPMSEEQKEKIRASLKNSRSASRRSAQATNFNLWE